MPLQGGGAGELTSAFGSAGTGAGESLVVGEDHRLDAVAGAVLGQDAADVCLHGGLGHDEAGSDLAVGPALADGDEDLALAFGEGGQSRVLALGRRATGSPSGRRPGAETSCGSAGDEGGCGAGDLVAGAAFVARCCGRTGRATIAYRAGR